MRVALLCLLASTAHAGDLCTPGAAHRGTVIDLDVKQADVQDVLRLLVDTAKINLVVGDQVTGKVTLHLQHVAWDAAACAIATLHHLRMTLGDGILLVTTAATAHAFGVIGWPSSTNDSDAEFMQ